MLRPNPLKQKISAGKAVLGTWAVIPSPVTADIVASAGLDFVIIDGEHGPIGWETVQQMVAACESRGVSPMVRVPGVAEADILKALDIGAHGVQVPNVDSKEAAARAASYAKYPPAGRRGFSPFTRAGNYSAQNARELARSANGNTLLAMHIEGPEAIENVEEILQTDALDVLFIGLYDISKSLGRAGDVDHADVLHAAERLVKAADKAGKCPGTIVTNAAQLNRFLGMGVRYITYSVDCDMLGRAYKQALSEFKEPALSRASKS